MAIFQAFNAGKNKAPLDQVASTILTALAEKLDAKIREWGSEGCFAKLSSRSPKVASLI
jgi:hypothetical protein